MIILAEVVAEKKKHRGTEVNMELSAVGERVFAAESIIKRRIRRVRVQPLLFAALFLLLLKRRREIRLCPEGLAS